MEAVKKISEYVAQLRRVGKGHGKHPQFSFIIIFIDLTSSLFSSFVHFYLYFTLTSPVLIKSVFALLRISGVWHFDQMLLHEEGAVDAVAA